MDRVSRCFDQLCASQERLCCNFLWRLKRGFGIKGLRRAPGARGLENVSWQTKSQRLTLTMGDPFRYDDLFRQRDSILTICGGWALQARHRMAQGVFPRVADDRNKNYRKWAAGKGKDSNVDPVLGGGRTISLLNHFSQFAFQGHGRYSNKTSRILDGKSPTADFQFRHWDHL